MKQLLLFTLIISGLSATAQTTYIFSLTQTQGELDVPVYSPVAATYTSVQLVTITATNSANIYYTLNNTAPSISSFLYTGPISVSTTTTIRAIAVKPNWATSTEANGTYTINLPVGQRDFPRTALLSTSNPKSYGGQAFRDQMEKFDILVTNAAPGYTDNGLTFQRIVDSLHANSQKPQGMIVLNYMVTNEESNPDINGAYPPYQAVVDKLHAANGWLFPNGSSGTPVSSTWPGKTLVNLTNWGPVLPGTGGRRWNRYKPFFSYETYYLNNGPAHGAASMPPVDMDGFHLDNMFPWGKKDGDWNRDGTTDVSATGTTAIEYRQGNVESVSELRTLKPDIVVIGNTASYRSLGATKGTMDQLFDGGLMEGQYGETWSPIGTAAMMASYKNQMDMYKGQKLGIFAAYVPVGDLVKERYVLTACLMGNGFLDILNGSLLYNQTVRWMDELNVNLGQPLAGQNPVYTPNASGTTGGVTMYRRNFTNGIAIMNPIGNGTKTINLGGTYYRCKGTNTGFPSGDVTGVSSVTIPDGSGVVLMNNPTN